MLIKDKLYDLWSITKKPELETLKKKNYTCEKNKNIIKNINNVQNTRFKVVIKESYVKSIQTHFNICLSERKIQLQSGLLNPL